jgi:hypothetical protein
VFLLAFIVREQNCRYSISGFSVMSVNKIAAVPKAAFCNCSFILSHFIMRSYVILDCCCLVLQFPLLFSLHRVWLRAGVGEEASNGKEKVPDELWPSSFPSLNYRMEQAVVTWKLRGSCYFVVGSCILFLATVRFKSHTANEKTSSDSKLIWVLEPPVSLVI